jgi:DNA-binding NtrC family response regulator
VDDEPNVLEGLALHLSPTWEVSTATSGKLALDLLAREARFAVVISDMRMPGMDGATLLRIVQERHPNTVRLLLTGHCKEAEAAMVAFNEGGLARVLWKPCPPHVLVSAVRAAVEQYARTVGE